MQKIQTLIIDSITLVIITLGGIPLLAAFIFFMILDFITGILVGLKERNISSEALRNGMFKKVGELIMVGALAVFCIVLIEYSHISPNIQMFTPALETAPTVVMGIFTIGEMISITENIANLGVSIPKRLTDILGKVKDEFENSDQENNT